MGVDSALSSDLARIIFPRRHVDARGWFSETYHEQRLRDLGITRRFVQDNQSGSKRAGTLRGLHFQVPPAAQAKLVSVARGRILDVAVDVRRGSATSAPPTRGMSFCARRGPTAASLQFRQDDPAAGGAT